MLQKKYYFFLLFNFSFWVNAQIYVTPTTNISQLQNQLKGGGIEISNFKVNGDLRQTGSFNDKIGILGVLSGIVMATGDARIAEGPNDGINESTSFGNLTKDPLLDQLAEDLGVSYNDAIIVEFDFTPKGNVFTFKYVLASEEYIEDDDDFPDFFGFWLTGPGFSEPVNLAKVPKTNLNVNTATINDKVNSQYFNYNGDGTTPIFNPFLGFDGYTSLLSARIDLIPCETYHLKMAIADARDGAKDSGVFIETNSLSSTQNNVFNVNYESSKKTMFEACADAEVTVAIDNKTMHPVEFFLKYSGSADSTDFEKLPKSVIIEENKAKGAFTLKAIQDLVKESKEELKITMFPKCDKEYKIDSVSIYLDDEMKKEVQDYQYCNKDTFQLQVFDSKKDLVKFSNSPLISCENCTNPNIYLIAEDTIYYTYTDIETNCEYSDSFKINGFKPENKFKVDTSVYYSILDLVAKIESSNMDRFYWDFDSEIYEGREVVHNGGLFNEDMRCVDVTLNSFQDSLHCRLKQDTTICWVADMTIPNIITPNGDGLNDYFVPKGITPGYWSLEIYNRYGKKVYFNETYDFDFKGENISDGTYFYYLENYYKNRQIKGWLQITR